jgi:hypothetical protein
METSKPVRGIIVAKEITGDLKLAASRYRLERANQKKAYER